MSAKGYCFLVIILISAFFVNLRWFSPYQALFIVTFIWGTYNQLRIDKMAEQVKIIKKHHVNSKMDVLFGIIINAGLQMNKEWLYFVWKMEMCLYQDSLKLIVKK